jgi:23S rRNA (adenine2030-N6)-methyltransferase
MLAYRHLFHAGGFADVFKHALLARFPSAFTRKPGPWFYLDTHAGTGRYDLTHPWAQKNAEYKAGVERIWGRDDAPAELEPYLRIVRAMNPDGELRQYPGSAEIVRRLRRRGDRMVLAELNTVDYAALEEIYAGEPDLSVLHTDGFRTFTAQLPPRERRGMVFIDPSFDQAREFDRLATAISTAHRRWPTGVLAAWYPLMQPDAMNRFGRRVAALDVRRTLQAELSVHPVSWRTSIRGCGLLIVNPPFGFAQEARTIAGWLAEAFAPGEGTSRVGWLVPE